MLPVEPTARPRGSIRSARTQDLVDAAFAILDEEGPDALTMRRLADDLGMRAPSLYKHVQDKATLEAALIEDVLFDMGDVLHAALGRARAAQGVVASVLHAYRERSLAHPNRYRLATSGRLRRDLLPECLEEWAGQPFFFAAGDPYRSQALWSFAHGMVILEIDGRYPEGSDLDRTWKAAAPPPSPAERRGVSRRRDALAQVGQQAGVGLHGGAGGAAQHRELQAVERRARARRARPRRARPPPPARRRPAWWTRRAARPGPWPAAGPTPPAR